MTRRATIPQATLDRALKAAAKAGYEVRIEGAVIRLLPVTPGATLPSAETAEEAWDRALGLQ